MSLSEWINIRDVETKHDEVLELIIKETREDKMDHYNKGILVGIQQAYSKLIHDKCICESLKLKSLLVCDECYSEDKPQS